MLQCQDFEFFFFSLLHQFIIVDLYFLIVSGKSQGKLQINAFLCSKVVSLPLSNAIATSNLMKALTTFLSPTLSMIIHIQSTKRKSPYINHYRLASFTRIYIVKNILQVPSLLLLLQS